MSTNKPLQYDFTTPAGIHFGWGRRTEVGKLARPLGRRAMIVAGSRTLESSGALDEVGNALRTAGMAVERLANISHEPEVGDVDAAVELARQLAPADGDFVVAIGGGSALDLAKGVAALATNRGGDSVKDYLEGVGRGLTLDAEPLPILAMPTTGGTGSEATRNAVISSYDPPFKKSLRDARLVPQVVLVDPELAVSLPAAVTAHAGLDAITQLIESYVSRRAQPLPQALALEGLARAVPAIVTAVEQGHNRPAREALAHAALLSGMALANSGLGLAHGVAAALGVHARVPHGLACAVMLPVAMRANRDVCQQAFAQLAPALCGHNFTDDAQAADAAVTVVEQLCRRLAIPTRLSALGVRQDQIAGLVRDSRGNSMSGNPRDIGDEELASLLSEML
ncbi:MAG: iron-containing alcohol dehydrogenase [Pirellulales bacterium]|nr:iron-containing alcohol dehydrogenase [Pirellulales bacterium]